MATIVTEEKRVRAGQELRQLKASGQNAVNTLTQVKAGLQTLKATAQNDADFTAEDAAEVQAVITSLATQIQALLA